MQRLNIWFDHGLGDCVHFAHVLQLYKRRGYDISVHYEGNKDLVWRAAGIPFTELEGSIYHRWTYPGDFNQPDADRDWSGSKIASNLNIAPLQKIGDIDAIWRELCSISLENSVDPYITEIEMREAETFVRHLPRPIILLHTSGTNMPSSKNLPPEIVTELYRILLDRCPGSLVLLDWDFRVATLPHARVRHSKRDWGHINLIQLAALMKKSSLLIGVDSGIYHFASLTQLPALGIFHDHYPSCVALPRGKNVNMTRAQEHRDVNISRRPMWNLVEYSGHMPSPDDIARHALRMVDGPRYGLPIGQDVMVQQWVRDWCLGATNMSPLADRNKTLDFLLQETGKRFAEPTIVETGCIRSSEDWSAGYSTYVFAAFLDGLGRGRLVSIDNTSAHCHFARQTVRPWGKRVTVDCCDSVEWLGRTDVCIDVLYLDSMDVETARHADQGLSEIQAAESKLGEMAIVVYDDSPWSGGWVGKGAKGIPYLLDRGWKVLAAGYQTVLSKI